MLVALQGHGFCWPTGRDRLLIVSVGTGHYRQPRPARAIIADPAALQGFAALQSLMDDCERMNRATVTSGEEVRRLFQALRPPAPEPAPSA